MASRYATTQEVLDLPGIVDPDATVTINLWLPITQLMIALCTWGRYSSDAHRFLTAHFLLSTAGPAGDGVITPGAMAAVVSAEANGPASRSFAVSTATPLPSDGDLAATQYGRAYLQLRRIIAGRGSVVVSNPCVRQRC